MNSSTLSSMTTAESLHRKCIGHLQLLTMKDLAPNSQAVADGLAPSPAEADSDAVTINLVKHQDELDGWISNGGMLALRVLAPFAPLSLQERKAIHMVAAGPGAKLAVIAGQDLSLGRNLLLEDATAKEIESSKGCFHRALFACDGKVPSKDDLLSILSLLRHDGQIALFGLPLKKITTVQLALSNSGFSTRAAGVNGELGFISGSIENMAHFRSKGSLSE